MVGSSLAGAFVAIVVFGTVGGTNPCDGVDPQHQSFVHAFTNYSCLYVRLSLNPKIDWTTSKEECEKLGASGYPHKWQLVETKTMAMHNELQRILHPLTQGKYWGWAGLVRDQAESGDNEGTWADPAKWRWLSDNTTLESFDGQLPWMAPDPNGHPTANCLMLVDFPPLGWYDSGCTGVIWEEEEQMLICELIDVSTTTSTTTTPTTTMITTSEATTTPTSETAESPTKPAPIAGEPTAETSEEQNKYKWAIWLLIGLNVVFIIVVAGIFYMTRNHEYKSLDDGTACDIEKPSACVDSSDRKVGKVRPRNVKKKK